MDVHALGRYIENIFSRPRAEEVRHLEGDLIMTGRQGKAIGKVSPITIGLVKRPGWWFRRRFGCWWPRSHLGYSHSRPNYKPDPPAIGLRWNRLMGWNHCPTGVYIPLVGALDLELRSVNFRSRKKRNSPPAGLL